MYPELTSTWLVGLAVAAETLSLLLFGRANTLWRSPGMQVYPQRFLFLRSILVLIWVHVGMAILAPQGWSDGYALDAESALLLVLLGMFGGLGLLLFSLGIRSIAAQLVFFGGSIHLLVAASVGWFLGELVTELRVGIISVLLVAQLAVLWRDRESWRSMGRSLRVLPFAVGLIWGTYFPLYGMAIKSFGFWPTLVAAEWGVVFLSFGYYMVRSSGTWRDGSMWRSMTEQSLLSSVGQALSGAALMWGGVILHSILTNFNVVVNTMIFRVAYGERLSVKYAAFFLLYIGLAALLVLGS